VTVDGTTFRETVPKPPTGAKDLIAAFTAASATSPVVFTGIGGDAPVLNGYAPHAVPEPASAGLLGVASLGLLAQRRRRARKH